MPVNTKCPNRIRHEPLMKSQPKKETAARKVLLVGSPNVGKSVLFNRLTGRYVTVSNYPGTTIELSKGYSEISGGKFEIIDTPGMYSLSAITEEEKVTSDLLLNQQAGVIVHVVDAKNIEQMLGLTLQLIEAGLPVILVLNMADEANQLGIKIDVGRLEKILGIPVVETIATTGEGVKKLIDKISAPCRGGHIELTMALQLKILFQLLQSYWRLGEAFLIGQELCCCSRGILNL